MTGNTSISLGVKFLWNFLLSLSALVVLAWALAALPCHLLGATLWLFMPGCHHVPEKGPHTPEGKDIQRTYGQLLCFSETELLQWGLSHCGDLFTLATTNHLWLLPLSHCDVLCVLLPLIGTQLLSFLPLLPIHPSEIRVGTAPLKTTPYSPRLRTSPLVSHHTLGWLLLDPYLIAIFSDVFFSTSYLWAL